MNKLKMTLGSGLLLVCLTGTTLANNSVYNLLSNIQNIVWLALAEDTAKPENITIAINPDECPVRDCGDCRPHQPNCRPRE